MKKIVNIILILSACMICACVENDIDSINLGDIHKIKNNITISDITRYIIDCKYDGVPTKSFDAVNITPVLNGPDTVMYLVNYERGWEVLSADRRAPVVLMACDDGYISESDLYQNPYQSEYVDGIKAAISDLKSNDEVEVVSEVDNWNSIAPLAEDPDTWTDWYMTGATRLIDTLANQDHLLVTHWGQRGAWNKKAPYTSVDKTSHCPTGCVMVAGSQLLYYLHYKIGCPQNIYGDCTCNAYIPDDVDYVKLNDENITFHEDTYGSRYWDLMPLSNTSSQSQTEYNYVSTLMSRIGYLISATYTSTATSAYTYDLLNAFQSDYSVNGQLSYSVDFDIVKEQIVTKQIPCIFSLGKSQSGSGHCVVADGYRQLQIFTRIFYQKHNNLAQIIKKEERILQGYQNYVAINWGWDGTGDYDSSTGKTIWYNTETIDWQGYDTLKYMLYGFEAIAD